MDKIIELLKPENLRYAVLLLGMALLGRSLAIINPEYGITILSPIDQHQEILSYFSVSVPKYVMTMLWPLAYSFLNSIDCRVRVTKPFFNAVMLAHMASLIVSLIWYFNYMPEQYSGTRKYDDDLLVMRLQAAMIFSVSIITSIFSVVWFNKGWMVFQREIKREGGSG
ncbi:hypothetical protein [Gayadomonas joobiniege]|uniref:hypothetical protein n=1 Tax=Gayadomonas joobiniege TaxID=1234606 RepID=UPI000367AC81|nr:hypothetical protein [Gayadomonas joobiniege]